MTAAPARPAPGRRGVSVGAVAAIAVASVAGARLAPVEWIAVAAALVPVVVAGIGYAVRLGVYVDAVSAVPIGLAVSTLVAWLVALAGYGLGLPAAIVVAALLGTVGLGLLLAAQAFAATLVAGDRRARFRTVAPHGSTVVVLAIGSLVVLVAELGPYYPAGFDSPFHTAVLRRLLESPGWLPPDPYFAPASLPVPQYGLGPWYPLLAVLATISGSDAMASLSGSVVPLAAVAGLALMAAVRAALDRAGRPGSEQSAETATSGSTGGQTGWVAALVALAAWIGWVGALRVGLDWRLLLLPEQVGLLVVVPATLAVLWAPREGDDRRRLVLLGGLGALLAPVHLVAAALLGAVLVAEMVIGTLRRERDTWLPAVVTTTGLAVGLAVTAVPLLAMVAAVGADSFGQPVYEERLLHVGPFVVLRPGLLLSAQLGVIALAAGVLVLVLGPRRSGTAGLAGGAVVGWLVLAVPPLTTVVVALAGAMYPTRLVTVPAALGIPLLGIATALVLARAPRLPAGWPVRLASGAVVLAVALATATAALTGSDGSGPPPWVSSAGRTAAARPDDRPAIRDLATLLSPHVPPDSTVLAELETAYVLPTVLDIRVVAVPAVHSISTDARHVNVGGTTEAGDDALRVLRRRGPIEARIAVLDRYAVTIVVVEPGLTGVDAATFAAEYEGRLRVVATDLGPNRLAVLAVIREGAGAPRASRRA